MNILRQKIDWLENNPTPEGFIDLRLYVNELEVDIKAQEDAMNDAMSEMWADVTKMQAFLAPYAKLNFDLSHHR